MYSLPAGLTPSNFFLAISSFCCGYHLTSSVLDEEVFTSDDPALRSVSIKVVIMSH